MTAHSFAAVLPPDPVSQRLREHADALTSFVKEWTDNHLVLLQQIPVAEHKPLSEATVDPCGVELEVQEDAGESALKGEAVAKDSKSTHLDDEHRMISYKKKENSKHISKKKNEFLQIIDSVHDTMTPQIERSLSHHSVKGVMRSVFDVAAWFFPHFTQVVLLADALVIALQTDFDVSHAEGEKNLLLEWLGISFTLYYILEIVAKICHDGPGAFCRGPDRRWHWFDTCLTVQATYDQILPLLGLSPKVNLSFLRMLRLLKILKLLRLIRLLRNFRELRLILGAAFCSLRVLAWASLLVLAITFFFGVSILQMRLSNLESNKDTVNIEKYWGSVSASMLTLCKATMGGQDWEFLAAPLESVGPHAQAALILYIFIYAYGITNVINSIFIETTIENSNRDNRMIMQRQLEMKEDYIDKLQILFDVMDDDGNGVVSLKEFEHHASQEEMGAFLAALEIEATDAKHLFEVLSRGGCEDVDLDHFITGCFKLKGAAKSLDLISLGYEQKHVGRDQNQFFQESKILLHSMCELSKQQNEFFNEVKSHGAHIELAADQENDAASAGMDVHRKPLLRL